MFSYLDECFSPWAPLVVQWVVVNGSGLYPKWRSRETLNTCCYLSHYSLQFNRLSLAWSTHAGTGRQRAWWLGDLSWPSLALAKPEWTGSVMILGWGLHFRGIAENFLFHCPLFASGRREWGRSSQDRRMARLRRGSQWERGMWGNLNPKGATSLGVISRPNLPSILLNAG